MENPLKLRWAMERFHCLGLGTIQTYYELFYEREEMKVCGDITAGVFWRDINVQTNRVETRKPFCPHYNLIELCANVMGISNTEIQRFKNFCGIINFVSFHQLSAQVPFTFCSALRLAMIQALQVMDMRISEKYLQNAILNCWQKSIPKNIGMRPQKYSKKETIAAVRNLLNALEEQAAGKQDVIIILAMGADAAPCLNAPIAK